QNLSLELVGRLRFARFQQLSGEATGVVYGTALVGETVASNLLKAAGVEDSNITLTASWPYALSKPIAKQSQAGFAEQAADWAYSNKRVLYQNASGHITDKEFSFIPTAAVASFTRGSDDILYEPVQSVFTIPTVTKVAGVGCEISATENPSIDVIDEVIDDFGEISPNSFGSIVGTRTIITKSYSLGEIPSYFEREQVFQVEALALQNPQIASQRIEVSDTRVAKYFQSGKVDITKAKLARQLTQVLTRGITLDPNDQFVNMRPTQQLQEDYEYDDDTETVSRYLSDNQQAEIILDSDSENPWDLQQVLGEDNQWSSYAPGLWDRTDKITEPIVRVRSNLDREVQNPYAPVTRTIPYDRSQDNRPPEPETFTYAFTEEAKHYTGQVTYIPDGGDNGRESERLFTVPDGMATSDAHMENLALFHLSLLRGWERSYETDIAINDGLLQAGPLPEVHAVTDVGTFVYLADAITFEFSLNRSLASFSGIWISGGYPSVLNAAAVAARPQLTFSVSRADLDAAATAPRPMLTFDIEETAPPPTGGSAWLDINTNADWLGINTNSDWLGVE
ncbi:MAG: hypothetical protein AAF959_11305, partial [Cyanobacteria bacterium P01_D01_bin.56]